jgi:AcrR family transcriptional regulator
MSADKPTGGRGPGADRPGPVADRRGPSTTGRGSTAAPGRDADTLRRRLDATERRAQILDAAALVFAATPYDEASVATVAAEAGVSEPLVFRYFPTKAALVTAVVQQAADRVAARSAAADAALPAGVPARDRVRAALEVRLDEVAAAPRSPVAPWRAGTLPAAAAEVLAAAERDHVAWLRALLVPGGWRRHEYALAGWPGFVTTACRAWADQGCPPDRRGPLVDAALGALEGALGDWGR